jgi:hypothetical protein
MANNLDRFGQTHFRAQAIPTIHAPTYAQDKTKGNPARGRLSGIAMTSGSPGDERSARMQARADAAQGDSARRMAIGEMEGQQRDAQMSRIANDAQMSRGEHPAQIEAQKAQMQMRQAREQESTLYKMRKMAELGHMIGDSQLGKDGLRTLPSKAAGTVAELTGLGNLAITNEGENAPKLAVKLVGDPRDPSSAQMQFFIGGGKEGFKPLTMGDGSPVAPRLDVVNNMLGLIDRIDYDTARTAGGGAGTKGGVDLQKEAMGNSSENARARLEAAQKNYKEATTLLNERASMNPKDPELKDLRVRSEFALQEFNSALAGVQGAGTSYSTNADAYGAQGDIRFRPFQLRPDFDHEGNPYGKKPAAAAPPGADKTAAPTPTGIPAPMAQTAPAREPGQPDVQQTYPAPGGMGGPWQGDVAAWQQQNQAPNMPAGINPRAGDQAAALARQNLDVHRNPAQYEQERLGFLPTPGQLDYENQRRQHAAMVAGQVAPMYAADMAEQRQIDNINAGYPAMWQGVQNLGGAGLREDAAAMQSAYAQARYQLGY